MFDDEETVVVHTTEDEGEEEEITTALEEADIHFIVQPLRVTFEALATDIVGYSQISVLQHDAEKATQVILPVVESYRATKEKSDSDDA